MEGRWCGREVVWEGGGVGRWCGRGVVWEGGGVGERERGVLGMGVNWKRGCGGDYVQGKNNVRSVWFGREVVWEGGGVDVHHRDCKG